MFYMFAAGKPDIKTPNTQDYCHNAYSQNRSCTTPRSLLFVSQRLFSHDDFLRNCVSNRAAVWSSSRFNVKSDFDAPR